MREGFYPSATTKSFIYKIVLLLTTLATYLLA
jgi:hypothetical protein